MDEFSEIGKAAIGAVKGVWERNALPGSDTLLVRQNGENLRAAQNLLASIENTDATGQKTALTIAFRRAHPTLFAHNAGPTDHEALRAKAKASAEAKAELASIDRVNSAGATPADYARVDALLVGLNSRPETAQDQPLVYLLQAAQRERNAPAYGMKPRNTEYHRRQMHACEVALASLDRTVPALAGYLRDNELFDLRRADPTNERRISADGSSDRSDELFQRNNRAELAAANILAIDNPADGLLQAQTYLNLEAQRLSRELQRSPGDQNARLRLETAQRTKASLKPVPGF